MELEPSSIEFKPGKDDRPHMPERPVVRLQAIEDVRLNTPAGVETQLDAFYVGLLRFERDADDAESIAYRAERFRLCFSVVERMPERGDYRPVMCDVPFINDVVAALNEGKIDFEWQKGITAGVDRVLLRDPAGNYVSVGPIIEIR
jgi:hypothetical protein